MDPSPAQKTPDRLPDWLAEALDVLSARRRVVVATAVGLVLLGAIVALLAPSILPPRAVVGAAVGIAATLLATALALAMDASDLVVRGARHVRAAGGTVDVRVGRQHDDVGPLLAAVSRHAGEGPLRVALAPASRSAGVPGARAAALAEALARTGRKVLLTDLTRGGSPAAGLSDVITGTRTLSEVVRFEQEMYLARLAVGSDPDAAIRGFGGWVEGLPSDLEVLVAALPPLADPGVLAASGSLDATFVLVEVGRTERVDLIASLDAVDAAALTCEVVLVDPERTAALATAEDAAGDDEPVADEPVADEPVDEAAEGEPAEQVAGDVATVPVSADEPLAAPPVQDDPFAPPPVQDEPAPAPAEDEAAMAAAVDDEHDAEAPAGDGEIEALLSGAATIDSVAATPVAPPTPSVPAMPSDPDEEPAADDTAEIHLPATGPSTGDDLSRILDAPDDADAEAGATVDDESRPAPIEQDPATVADAPTTVAPPEHARDSPSPSPSRGAPVLDDDAALQVARTSAALQQLAQQIWERDER